MLFLQENNDSIFVKIWSRKEWKVVFSKLGFWVFNDPFNQIILKINIKIVIQNSQIQ